MSPTHFVPIIMTPTRSKHTIVFLYIVHANINQNWPLFGVDKVFGDIKRLTNSRDNNISLYINPNQMKYFLREQFYVLCVWMNVIDRIVIMQ